MITYHVEGRSKTVKLIDIIDAVEFACDSLDLFSFRGMHLAVILSPDLPQHVTGYCNGIDDDEAEIELSSHLKPRELIATIFHELVHVKQILEGYLVQGECGDPTTWKGVPYINEPYDTRPWEIQAHELETHLLEKYYVPRTVSRSAAA